VVPKAPGAGPSTGRIRCLLLESHPTRFAGRPPPFRGGNAEGAIDAVSLSHIAQITSAMELSCIACAMFQNPAGTCAMLQIEPWFQIDLWVKAAECERAIPVVTDPERRSVLINPRSLRVALGNEESIFDRPRQVDGASKTAQIHAELMSLHKNAMN
jgi:hypothetical protein